MKTIMYNPQTGDLLATITKPGSKGYDGYINKGYQPIGHVSGFNVKVEPLMPISEYMKLRI